MPRVIHFEMQARDTERAIGFYRDVFGWQAQKWGDYDYWLITTGDDAAPGINGGLSKATDEAKLPPSTNTIDVPNVDEYVAKITSKGGKVIHSKMAVPTVGYLAYCEDTEGNTFGIMQFDPDAK